MLQVLQVRIEGVLKNTIALHLNLYYHRLIYGITLKWKIMLTIVFVYGIKKKVFINLDQNSSPSFKPEKWKELLETTEASRKLIQGSELWRQVVIGNIVRLMNIQFELYYCFLLVNLLTK